jgi:glycosyltransferase involved in cell wall biosynthesis
MPPLVSIFNFCKDRKQSIRRSLESVLNQSYENLEIVIQDGRSTDGTVEIIQSYKDPRIKLVSEPDAGPADAFWKAIKRCRGEFICSCLSDEELLPTMVEEGVVFFEKDAKLGAVYRDVQLTDAEGLVGKVGTSQSFNIVKYVSGGFAPYFISTMFRKSALDQIGLQTRAWEMDCGEFELLCRLGLNYRIDYQPGAAAKYALHEGQLSREPANVAKMFHARARVIKKLFEDESALAAYKGKESEWILMNGVIISDYLIRGCDAPEYAREIVKICDELGNKMANQG